MPGPDRPLPVDDPLAWLQRALRATRAARDEDGIAAALAAAITALPPAIRDDPPEPWRVALAEARAAAADRVELLRERAAAAEAHEIAAVHEASEARYRLLAENARDVIWVYDLGAQRFSYVSPSVTGLRGITVEQALAERLEDSLAPESLERAMAVLNDVMSGAAGDTQTGVYAQRCADGSIRHVEMTTTLMRDADGRPWQTVGVSRDVTERVEAERAVRLREERLRLALEASNAGWADFDMATGELILSTRAAEVLGIERAGNAGAGMTADVLPSDLRTVIAETYRERIASNGEINVVTLVRDAAGTERWVNMRARASDTLGVVSGLVFDITDPKRLDDALRESEERFRVAFQTSPDAIALNRLDDAVYLAVNEGFLRLTGYREEELIGTSSLVLGIWSDLRDRERLFEGLRARGTVDNLDAMFRVKDGRLMRGLMSARIIELRGELVILTITRDISAWRQAEDERDRLREQLSQAQKLESVGRLAGGIAHDFNNLLTVILSWADVLRQDALAGVAVNLDDLEEIRAAATRASDLTRQLLAFGRKTVIAPVVLNLNGLLTGLGKLLRRVLGEDIELVMRVDPALWLVSVDPGQLEQVVMNLVVNARDAMPRGGRLTIQTANLAVTVGGDWPHPEERPGDYVRLTVEDTGTGIPPDVLQHLFEPFFTTKPHGKGTGLGLATAYGIVAMSGGQIHVSTEEGRGTRFEIVLPRSLATAPDAPPEAPVGAVGGSERILVVEDDPQVREVAVRSLRAAGYHVDVASGGPEALGIDDSTLEAASLLLTDVIMPGISGVQLADELRRRCPSLRVLFVSGYTADTVAEHGVVAGEVGFLAKPFTPAVLKARVRAILDEA